MWLTGTHLDEDVRDLRELIQDYIDRDLSLDEYMESYKEDWLKSKQFLAEMKERMSKVTI